MGLTRRRLIELGLVLPLPFVAGRWVRASEAAPLTPACDDHPTHPDALGPFFKPSSPKRTKLTGPGVAGVPLLVTGRVLSTSCRPVSGAVLDFWQADGRGVYDNSGFRLRGHQFTDKQGRFRLETVYPGLYPGRSRHIHVRAQAPGGKLLTTQLFFPGVPRNQSDALFDPALLTKVTGQGAKRHARFDFVLSV